MRIIIALIIIAFMTIPFIISFATIFTIMTGHVIGFPLQHN